MSQISELTLDCLAIGSLPCDNLEDAMGLVKIFDIPFWPQLAKISKNEDMIVQFLENMPSFFVEKDFLDTECDEFFEDIEQFLMDYEEVCADCSKIETIDALDKYGISEKYSVTFSKFIELVKNRQPKFAKGQIVGPFTLATTLVDNSGRCAFYDETLKEIIVKTLALKALWQVKQIKCASPNTTPIIFIDEPCLSQLGTSAFLTISQDDVVEMISSISDLIKQSGGISAIHCCGKCDWEVPIKCGVDIINLDAYSYAQNLSVFDESVNKFLENGGKIAWGIVPTLDSAALEKADINTTLKVFEKAVKYLTKKGISEKIILDNSLITPSCGAGSLSEVLARKAMELTVESAKSLKERYYGV